MFRFEETRRLIAVTLDALVPGSEALDWHRWRVGGGSGSVEILVELQYDGWLILSRPCVSLEEGGVSGWELVRRNVHLPCGFKYVLLNGSHLELRAEIPVDEETDVIEQLSRTLPELSQVALLQGSSDATANLPEVPPTGSSLTIEQIRKLCEDAQWSVNERTSGLAVTLEARGFWQALIEETPGGVRVSIELLGPQSLSETACEALALFLLSACITVRMVRPVGVTHDGNSRVQFEACLPQRLSSTDLHHALAALSVACSLCGREIPLLAAEAAAQEYLLVRGQALYSFVKSIPLIERSESHAHD